VLYISVNIAKQCSALAGTYWVCSWSKNGQIFSELSPSYKTDELNIKYVQYVFQEYYMTMDIII